MYGWMIGSTSGWKPNRGSAHTAPNAAAVSTTDSATANCTPANNTAGPYNLTLGFQ